MRLECRIKVGEILGRKLSEEEGVKIINSLKYTMRSLKDADPNFSSLTHSQQIQKAAEAIASQIQAEAKQKVRNRNLQVLAQAKVFREMKRLRDEDGVYAYKAIGKILVNADNKMRGVTSMYIDDLADMFNGIDSNMFGLLEDRKSAREFVRAAFGERAASKSQKAFDAFSKVNNALFVRAKNAGLISGKLERYLPQNHDWYKIGRVGVDQWIADIKPMLDKSRFMNEDGTQMREIEIDSLLERAYMNIVSDGNPDSAFDIQGQIKARRNGVRFENQHRVLYFKDSDSWIKYHDKYGMGSLTSLLLSHIRKMSHDVSMLEDFGPNPESTYEFAKSIAETESKNMRLKNKSFLNDWKYGKRLGLFLADIDDVWKNYTGEANALGSPSRSARYVSDGLQTIRNLEVAGMLGKAFISSFSDVATYFSASGVHNIAWSERIAMLPRVFRDDYKEFAKTLGIVSDTIIGDFNRLSAENLGQGWSAKLADATLRASLLPAWTDAVRRAFSLNLMAVLGKWTQRSWDELNKYDRALLQNGGLSADDWEIIRKAGVQTFKGSSFLNFQHLKEIDPKVASRLLGYVIKENEMASLAPSLITRAEMNRGYQKGTPGGELSRAFFMFKSFPTSMMEKTFERMTFLSKRGTKPDLLAYMAWSFFGTTVMGAISLQLSNLLNGKDARDMETPEFWLNAMAKGGGLGFWGDFLYNQFSEDPSYGAWGAVQMAGPVITTGIDSVALFMKAVNKPLYDKDTKLGASALRLVRSHTPFVNLWYTGAAIDRAVMNQINEALSPGYTRKMQRRAMKTYGQGYWWSPTDISNVRSPRMANEPN